MFVSLGSRAGRRRAAQLASNVLLPTLSPVQLASAINNWAPGNATDVEVVAASGGSTITGMLAGADGQLRAVSSVGGGTDTITFASSSGSSSLPNRFQLPNSNDLTISPNDVAVFIYNITGGGAWYYQGTRGLRHGHTSNADGGTLSAAAIATGQLALTRGGTNADLSGTGGPHQFLKQSSANGPVTVGTIAAADISAEAWTAFTPTVTAQTGTPTTVSATGRYIQYGKIVYCQMDVTITTVGTAAGSVKATLPVTAAANVYAGSTYEYNTSGKSGAAVILGSAGSQNDATHVWFRDATGTTLWVNGYKVAVTIVYEAA